MRYEVQGLGFRVQSSGLDLDVVHRTGGNKLRCLRIVCEATEVTQELPGKTSGSNFPFLV